MVQLLLVVAAVTLKELSPCQPPPGLTLKTSKCLLIQDTDGGMTLPSHSLLLSEDGRRGFSPWSGKAASASFSVIEFASSTTSSVTIFQHRAKPTVLTFRQWRDVTAFNARARQIITDIKPPLKLLNSADATHITLAHSAQVGGRIVSGITTLALDDLDFTKNSSLLSMGTALSAIMDPITKSYLVRVASSRDTYTVVQPPSRTHKLETKVSGTPLHFRWREGLVISVPQGDRPKSLLVQRIRYSNAVEVKPPAKLGNDVYVWQTAMLPNGDLLASFEQQSASPLGESPTVFGLYRLSRPTLRWSYAGPFRLQGASSSGNVLLLSGKRGMTEHYLVWPKE